MGSATGAVIRNKMDKQAHEIKTALPGAEVESEWRDQNNFQWSNSKFWIDSAVLTPTTKNNLRKLAETLNNNPDTDINIHSHTDNRGINSYNLPLSEKRANTVVDYLSSFGISKSRMTTKGLRKNEPIATNDTEEERAKKDK